MNKLKALLIVGVTVASNIFTPIVGAVTSNVTGISATASTNIVEAKAEEIKTTSNIFEFNETIFDITPSDKTEKTQTIDQLVFSVSPVNEEFEYLYNDDLELDSVLDFYSSIYTIEFQNKTLEETSIRYSLIFSRSEIYCFADFISEKPSIANLSKYEIEGITDLDVKLWQSMTMQKSALKTLKKNVEAYGYNLVEGIDYYYVIQREGALFNGLGSGTFDFEDMPLYTSPFCNLFDDELVKRDLQMRFNGVSTAQEYAVSLRYGKYMKPSRWALNRKFIEGVTVESDSFSIAVLKDRYVTGEGNLTQEYKDVYKDRFGYVVSEDQYEENYAAIESVLQWNTSDKTQVVVGYLKPIANTCFSKREFTTVTVLTSSLGTDSAGAEIAAAYIEKAQTDKSGQLPANAFGCSPIAAKLMEDEGFLMSLTEHNDPTIKFKYSASQLKVWDETYYNLTSDQLLDLYRQADDSEGFRSILNDEEHYQYYMLQYGSGPNVNVATKDGRKYSMTLSMNESFVDYFYRPRIKVEDQEPVAIADFLNESVHGADTASTLLTDALSVYFEAYGAENIAFNPNNLYGFWGFTLTPENALIRCLSVYPRNRI